MAKCLTQLSLLDQPADRTGVLTVVLGDRPEDLARLLQYAREKLGDRLVGQTVFVDLSIAGATEEDVEIFRTNSAPVQMVADWEMSDGE